MNTDDIIKQTSEWAVFNDEGCIESGCTKEEAETKASKINAFAAEECIEHEGHAAHSCAACCANDDDDGDEWTGFVPWPHTGQQIDAVAADACSDVHGIGNDLCEVARARACPAVRS